MLINHESSIGFKRLLEIIERPPFGCKRLQTGLLASKDEMGIVFRALDPVIVLQWNAITSGLGEAVAIPLLLDAECIRWSPEVGIYKMKCEVGKSNVPSLTLGSPAPPQENISLSIFSSWECFYLFSLKKTSQLGTRSHSLSGARDLFFYVQDL